MTNVHFVDDNFRLACLDNLLNSGHFRDELTEILDIPDYEDGWEVNPKRVKAFCQLSVTQDLLDEIKSFAPDGGDDIYFHVFPHWGGTEDELYIRSFADLKKLRNLEHLSVYAVAERGAFDLSLLVSLPNLQSVDTDYFYLSPACDIDRTVATLEERGIDVTIRGSRRDG